MAQYMLARKIHSQGVESDHQLVTTYFQASYDKGFMLSGIHMVGIFSENTYYENVRRRWVDENIPKKEIELRFLLGFLEREEGQARKIRGSLEYLSEAQQQGFDSVTPHLNRQKQNVVLVLREFLDDKSWLDRWSEGDEAGRLNPELCWLVGCNGYRDPENPQNNYPPFPGKLYYLEIAVGFGVRDAFGMLCEHLDRAEALLQSHDGESSAVVADSGAAVSDENSEDDSARVVADAAATSTSTNNPECFFGNKTYQGRLYYLEKAVIGGIPAAWEKLKEDLEAGFKVISAEWTGLDNESPEFLLRQYLGYGNFRGLLYYYEKAFDAGLVEFGELQKVLNFVTENLQKVFLKKGLPASDIQLRIDLGFGPFEGLAHYYSKAALRGDQDASEYMQNIPSVSNLLEALKQSESEYNVSLMTAAIPANSRLHFLLGDGDVPGFIHYLLKAKKVFGLDVSVELDRLRREVRELLSANEFQDGLGRRAIFEGYKSEWKREGSGSAAASSVVSDDECEYRYWFGHHDFPGMLFFAKRAEQFGVDVGDRAVSLGAEDSDDDRPVEDTSVLGVAKARSQAVARKVLGTSEDKTSRPTIKARPSYTFRREKDNEKQLEYLEKAVSAGIHPAWEMLLEQWEEKSQKACLDWRGIDADSDEEALRKLLGYGEFKGLFYYYEKAFEAGVIQFGQWKEVLESAEETLTNFFRASGICDPEIWLRLHLGHDFGEYKFVGLLDCYKKSASSEAQEKLRGIKGLVPTAIRRFYEAGQKMDGKNFYFGNRTSSGLLHYVQLAQQKRVDLSSLVEAAEASVLTPESSSAADASAETQAPPPKDPLQVCVEQALAVLEPIGFSSEGRFFDSCVAEWRKEWNGLSGQTPMEDYVFQFRYWFGYKDFPGMLFFMQRAQVFEAITPYGVQLVQEAVRAVLKVASGNGYKQLSFYYSKIWDRRSTDATHKLQIFRSFKPGDEGFVEGLVPFLGLKFYLEQAQDFGVKVDRWLAFVDSQISSLEVEDAGVFLLNHENAARALAGGDRSVDVLFGDAADENTFDDGAADPNLKDELATWNGAGLLQDVKASSRFGVSSRSWRNFGSPVVADADVANDQQPEQVRPQSPVFGYTGQ